MTVCVNVDPVVWRLPEIILFSFLFWMGVVFPDQFFYHVLNAARLCFGMVLFLCVGVCYVRLGRWLK